MSKNWSKLTLAFCIPVLMLASCAKKISSDAPLSNSYAPSVIGGSDNNIVFAYDPTNGAKNWELALPCAEMASPLVYYGRVYICCTNLLGSATNCDTIYKVNSKTGQIVSKFAIGQLTNIVATPMADGKSIFVAGTNDSLYSIDTGSGAINWRYSNGSDMSPITSSPVVYNGAVYFGTVGGWIHCVKESDGTDLWDYNAGAAGGVKSFTSSSAVSSPYLYIGCSDSSMYCLYLTSPTATGILKWTFQTKGSIQSSPAAEYGKCIFGSKDFHIYCVDSSTGRMIWKDSTFSDVVSSPVIYNQQVYVGSNDYRLYCLNLINGHEIWSFSTNGAISSSPLVYKDRVFIGSLDKYLYAVDTASGSLRWSTNVNGQIECSPALEDYSNKQYNSQLSGFTN